MSSDYPQALRAPQITAESCKIGSVTIGATETNLITPQSVALYLESISVTFLTSAGVEIPTAILKIYTDITDTATPTITLTPDGVRGTYRIASMGSFQIKSQSPGSISIEPINPVACHYLRVTGQGLSAGDTCSRIVIWRV